MNKRELLALKPSQLLTHPRNMRRIYLAEQVREMANSIAASNGVIQPLIVQKDPSGKWLVVDGNMRLAGARLLGDKCPALDCKIVEQKELEQFLTMTAVNKVRYDVDPVSEGMHFKALQDEGMSVREISKKTGVYEARISNRLVLADLEEPIQKLIAAEKFPADARVARALLELTPAVRIKLVSRCAENPNMKLATIINACERLRPENKKTGKKLKRPAVELSGALTGKGATDVKTLRAAAKKMCESCNQVEDKLRQGDEPAWAFIVHEADKNCNDCTLKDMQEVCAQCPAVSLLRNLMKGSVSGRSK